ncbi:LysR family transcriptional regulator [Kibdelosporangium phytohabitans]|uniref:LysR family transcriptional regulator n=1 Tax=Kibdelosporangium phytohabitans TaxID=860235 RepID=A0A0N9IJ13_9PSEU|nr:LysR family transcriptional regulator [Kibdelosporangium phytohabitans]ALG15065.1 LysR family transcriptional regulator [Kibdelosporangium phytohabitans]MBE1468743.1 DNA-binding transcriptional LysR family regulator [Kibdelosporangium phytohabitans]
MSDVELRHLTAMTAVADEGSFGRAAARLGYTQSTVSQQIAALEKAVGGAVFDRPGGPRPVRITPLGVVVLAHGRDLLARAQAMAAAVDRFKAGDGRIDIGTFQSVSNVILPLVVRRLRDEHPGCDIRLSEEEADPPEAGELDLLFFDGRVDGDFEHLKLLDDPYFLVARRGTFPDGPVGTAELDGVPMVAQPPICDQARLEQELARRGVRPRIVFRTAGNETVLSMVRAGMGSAVLPQLAVHSADVGADESLCAHELRPALPPREIFLLWQAGRTRSPLAVRATEIAVEVTAEIAERAPLPK